MSISKFNVLGGGGGGAQLGGGATGSIPRSGVCFSGGVNVCVYGLCMGFGVHTALLAFCSVTEGSSCVGGLVKALTLKPSFFQSIRGARSSRGHAIKTTTVVDLVNIESNISSAL